MCTVYKMMREWEEKQFDAIITLASPLPAISPEVVSSLISGACYTAVYNLTGCPAGQTLNTSLRHGLCISRHFAGDQGQ